MDEKENKTHAEIIAEQLTNIESLGDELPAVIAAGSLRKLLRHLDAAHKREIEDAERRGNHEATEAICETIEKAGPFYDAESVGNSVQLRKALKSCVDEMCDRCRELAAARGNPLPCLSGCEPVRKAKFALKEPPRNCDRFGGDINKLREACVRERGLNPDEDFPEVFCEWLLAKAKGGNDVK